jgi:hypothetical protein
MASNPQSLHLYDANFKHLDATRYQNKVQVPLSLKHHISYQLPMQSRETAKWLDYSSEQIERVQYLIKTSTRIYYQSIVSQTVHRYRTTQQDGKSVDAK